MSTLLERLQYGFDRDSRRTWRKRSLTTGEDNHYGYDGLSHVANAARGNLNQNATAIGAVPAQAEAWDYDPTGNWRGYRVEDNGAVTLEQHRVHDKGNRLTQIEEEAQAILLDRAGRMRQVSPDATGDWDQALEITWDAWSRPVQVKRGSDGEVLGSYAYDGLTRRVTQSVGSTTTHTYYSDAWRPLEERLDSQTTAARQYYWGARHRDDLVRRDRATTGGGSLDETRYVLMDYFSPAAITDASGNVTERYSFSAFGIRRILNPDFTPRTDSECAFDFAFQGQFLDSESGFLNYGYRYYSPQLGRWLCKDPAGESGGLNLYDQVNNAPVNAVDYLGLAFSIGEGINPGLDDLSKSLLGPDAPNSGLDNLTKSLLGPCGCDIGGDIPSFIPPPPPPPVNPPPKATKPFTPSQRTGGHFRRGGDGVGLTVDEAIAKSTFWQALTGSAGRNVDQTQRYIDTKQLGTIDLQHVVSAAIGPPGAPTVGGLMVEINQMLHRDPSAFKTEDIISNVLGGVARDYANERRTSIGREVGNIINNAGPQGIPYGRSY